MKFWDTIPINSMYPPIIGVDVASGAHKDASAITVIDSETTKVLATFRSNFITMPELADLLYQFITNYAKNAICCVENNGEKTTTNTVSQTTARRGICEFHSVNCYEKGQELYAPQRDLKRCA